MSKEPRLPFADRRDAAGWLARKLEPLRGRNDVIVLGLPRGGVPVAEVVARALGAPLDVVVVRKLGAPGQEELAAGAIAPGGIYVLNPEVIGYFSNESIARVAEKEARELERRERLFRAGRPPLEVEGKLVILIDDGIATGATMRAAVAWARAHRAARVIVAIPVAPPPSVAQLAAEADEVVCLAMPEEFAAVGSWYRDFTQVSDQEVVSMLRASAAAAASSPPSPPPPPA